MVRKINDEYFLNRTEAIEYLSRAYQLKWCMTRWEKRIIRITYAGSDGVRGNAKFEAYKCPKSKTLSLRKFDLDTYLRDN